MHLRHLLSAAALAALSTSAAWADTVVVQTTLDPAAIIPGLNGFTGGVQGTPPFTPGFNVAVAEGDTFDYTISFIGGQSITINGASFIWAFSYADVATDVTAAGTLQLLDAFGAVVLQSNLKTDTEGVAHLGQSFGAGDFPSVPASLTFSGLRYVGTVLDYVVDGVTTRNYSTPAFYFFGNGFVTSVPEPAPWLLTALGLGALALRRRISRR